MANRLADATSPYLLQHKDNPVHWQPWDRAALDQAEREDKPILLSVGYAACHWCHVMAHESFENEAIAGLMNRDYVSIKVDREERPDLDAIYQQALALLGQQGGWPLTMFLTPSGEPFWGGTYFPPEPRYGRVGLPQVLQSLAQIWREDRGKVHENTRALGEALQRMATPPEGGRFDLGIATPAASAIANSMDPRHGGLNGAPKFPNAPVLDFVWRMAARTGDDRLRQPVLHTLRRMSQGGIYDHLGGGFSRYSVDEAWLVPHFEKMLYDNAQLIELLADAWVETGERLFKERARETVAWLQREMRLPDGGFASSLDADSEGEEGRFYVWDEAEIGGVLGDAAPAFKHAYGVTAAGNWEGKTILNRLHEEGLPPPDQARALAAARASLLERRAVRVRPGLDDKVLADWNGMTVAALTRAAFLLDEPGWLDLAKAAFGFVVAAMSQEGRLFHAWRDGRRLEIGFVDDYAQMMRAALLLFEATGERSYRDHAETWARVLDGHYRTETGGYATASVEASDLLVRSVSAFDGPLPSGNGTLAGAFARLGHLTGDTRYLERADGILNAFAGMVAQQPLGHCSLLSASLLLDRPVQVVLMGDAADSERTAMHRLALASPVPEIVVQALGRDETPADGHPAAGKRAEAGKATAYVCVGRTCRLPVTTTDALRAELAPRNWRAPV
ncbi:thioredoxin domain-containing protein [Marinivivus vitaminiproducens]|uniref:thioredoxin domain-containing protein n=1 Tax=Marinivivus vitaminiproducens TaxID=3035935 RepID=UPI0027A7F512|nr:thioredoxin domain-containing protein [Geminicoccaceae bacterium SCSIO 64248]